MLVVVIILAVLFAMLGSFAYGAWYVVCLLEKHHYINPYRIVSDFSEEFERKVRKINRKLRRKISIMF